jgi:probable HAF family extracellular repeat protein
MPETTGWPRALSAHRSEGVHLVILTKPRTCPVSSWGTDRGNSARQANAINNSGVIVGNGGNGDAFIYQNGQATDLNNLIAPGSGFTLITADGINNNGDIVGTAVSSVRNATFGYELTPVG